MTATTTVLSDQLDAVIEEETDAFVARQPQSRAFRDRAHRLAGGATSNWQIAEPQAVWISHGSGSKLYDVDGFEYSDFHGGYGVSLAGHAHPAIVAAVQERVTRGTHFAQPTEDAIVVAENLAERFDQPLWRFAQLRHRGHDGRRPPDARGDRAGPDHQGRGLLPRPPRLGAWCRCCPRPTTTSGRRTGRTTCPTTAASPPRSWTWSTVVPFNDLAAVERVLTEHPGEVAGMILEPVMMNAGIIHPIEGYLAGPQGAAAPARRAAHLRRGEDRPHRRARAASPGCTA